MSWFRIWFTSGIPITTEAESLDHAKCKAVALLRSLYGNDASEEIECVDEVDASTMECHLAMKLSGLL